MSDDGGEKGIGEIHRDILRLRERLETMVHGIDVDDFTPGRRGTMKLGGAAIIGAGAMATYSGTAAADDGSESGQIGTAAEPALKVFVDEFQFHPRSSHPSSPDDGTMYYNDSP